MSVINADIIRSVTLKSDIPVVFRGCIIKWPICQWNLEKWSNIFGQKEYPFRCINNCIQSDKPCWERRCTIKNMTFQKFSELAVACDEAMYFDYKYLHEWFAENDELSKSLHWEQLGFQDMGYRDTTLWIGSGGAHTPAHQDTYGVNIVVQVHGTKLWILFPAESEGLKPSRVPYEESSVYSELNFYCPTDAQVFKGVKGARVVVLSAGDALVVPHKWWHYVQNEDPVNISLNMWLPHEEDATTRMSEAVIKIFVAQLIKDLSREQANRIVNPTEDDLTDTPITVLLAQLKAATNQCLEKENQARRRKRQKTNDGDSTDTVQYDLDALILNPENKMEIPETITGEDLVILIEKTKSRFKKTTLSLSDDEDDTSCVVKSLINAFCQGNIVEQFKQNLLSQINDH